MRDGKWLEHLASVIEKQLLPEHFTVSANEKVFDEQSGIQIAEFDIVVSGRLGSTAHRWLFECRDRPSKGSAPGSWIEQLVGRRELFRFDRVIAVSTTGFSDGAKALAKRGNVELHSVDALTVESVADWFKISTLETYSCYLDCEHVTFLFADIDEEACSEVRQILQSQVFNTVQKVSMAIHPRTGNPLDVRAEFFRLVQQKPQSLAGLKADGEPKPVKCILKYPDPSERYQFPTPAGMSSIAEIQIEGALAIRKSEVPISRITEYYNALEGDPIAQSVQFETQVGERSVSLHFHNLGEADKSFVSLQGLPEKDDQTFVSAQILLL